MLKTISQVYPFWNFEFEVIAPDAVALGLLPLQLLDGEAEVGEVGDVSGLDAMIGEFLLDGSGGPEVFALMLCGGLEDFREHQLWSGCLLELLVMMLDFLLVITGEPIDAVWILQFRDGLGEHLGGSENHPLTHYRVRIRDNQSIHQRRIKILVIMWRGGIIQNIVKPVKYQPERVSLLTIYL